MQASPPAPAVHGAVQAVQAVPGRELSPILVQETPLEGDMSCSLDVGSGMGPFPPRALALWMGLTPTPVAPRGPHLCLARRWGIHPRRDSMSQF